MLLYETFSSTISSVWKHPNVKVKYCCHLVSLVTEDSLRIKPIEPRHETPAFCMCENKDADQLRGNHDGCIHTHGPSSNRVRSAYLNPFNQQNLKNFTGKVKRTASHTGPNQSCW